MNLVCVKTSAKSYKTAIDRWKNYVVNFQNRSSIQDRKKTSNIIESKQGKPNVRFAQDTTKGITVQSTVKPLMTSATSENFLSPLQVQLLLISSSVQYGWIPRKNV